MAPALALGISSHGGHGFPATSPIKPCAPADGFHQMVDELNRILGPSSGLNSEEIDVQAIQKLMERYNSRETEWQKYAFADLSRGYTRNLVDEGNGKSNLVRPSSGATIWPWRLVR